MSVKPFSREPALVLAAFAALVQFLSIFFFNLTDAQQGLVNGVAVAVAGFIAAWKVSADKALPAIAGIVQALLSLAVGFGAHIGADQQVVVMTFVSALVALFVRQNVVAPVDSLGNRVSLPGAAPATSPQITRQTGGAF